MDSFYRHFHYVFGCTLKNSNVLLEDKLKHAADYVEGLYQNWFIKELTGCWTKAISDNLAALGYVSETASKETSTLTMLSRLRGKTPAPS